jgi:hypothetical protein
MLEDTLVDITLKAFQEAAKSRMPCATCGTASVMITPILRTLIQKLTVILLSIRLPWFRWLQMFSQ